MIQDSQRLWTLIDEYGHLNSLQGHTPQTRGQRLNGFIAELLQCWGINAKANVRGAGEIDVGFDLDGRHYVVEAKWEASPVATGPIAKLQKRLRQRLGGTIGVLVSMSGYTTEAIRDLKEGEQLQALLLSREHLEAMLSGFVPPAELISRLVARASFLGDGFVPLKNLFESPQADELGISFSCPQEIQTLIRDAIPGFRAEVSASSLPFGQAGVAELSSGEILVTLEQCVGLLDLAKRTVNVCSPVPSCSRNPLVGDDGDIYIVRKAGVGRISDGQLTLAAGGYCGNTCLFKGSGNEVWVFANGYPGSPPQVSLLGACLGNESRYEINYPSATGVNATLLADGRFLIVGSAGIAIADLAGSRHLVNRDLVNPMGLMRQSGSHYVVASGDVELSELDVATLSSKRIADLNLQGSVSEIARSASGGGYLFSHYSTTGGQTKGILVRWHL
jgi:hypothetical protein